MYYSNYEDYMRSVLGYPNIAENSYGNYDNNNYYQVSMSMQEMPQNQPEQEELYPEIYRLLNPMVCKACEEAKDSEITEELVERLTNTIYINFEAETTEESNTVRKQENRNGDVRNPNAKEEMHETRQSNPFLRDLIRILILKRLFQNRRQRPPVNRPHMPFPGRPPMPGPGNRPPFPRSTPMSPVPRGYEDLYY